jgi:hypothetical protein
VGDGCDGATQSSWVSAASREGKFGGVPWVGGRVSWRAAPSGLFVLQAARHTARRMAGASGAKRTAASSPLAATRSTSDELTVLYSNGPDDRSVKLALGYVTAADTEHCKAHGGGRRCQHEGCTKSAADGGTLHCKVHGGGKRCQHEGCTKSARGDTGH